MRVILVTGAAGMIGQEVVRELLHNTDDELYLLIHDKSFGPELGSPSCRVRLIQGDIRKKNLGLSKEDASELRKKVTVIIHAAANTEFNQSIKSARETNVVGTANVIQFAENCTDLKKFVFLSTLYVAGQETGNILEKPSTNKSGFVNSYEQSKHEAEHVVQKSILPTTIIRLSTLLGDSRTGATTRFTAPHQAFRLIWAGLAAMIPGSSDYKVDLMATDYSAKMILLLMEAPIGIYQLSSGDNHSISLEELIDRTYKAFKKIDAKWANREYPKPEIVSEDVYELFTSSLETAKNPIFSKINGALTSFSQQLSLPKNFDHSNTLKAIPDYEKRMPKIELYLPKVLSYCVKTNWGKHG